MTKHFCEICSIEVCNLSRHRQTRKHKRFEHSQQYGNYSDEQLQEHNNILRKGFKDNGRIEWLSYLYTFFAYIFNIMSLQRVER